MAKRSVKRKSVKRKSVKCKSVKRRSRKRVSKRRSKRKRVSRKRKFGGKATDCFTKLKNSWNEYTQKYKIPNTEKFDVFSFKEVWVDGQVQPGVIDKEAMKVINDPDTDLERIEMLLNIMVLNWECMILRRKSDIKYKRLNQVKKVGKTLSNSLKRTKSKPKLDEVISEVDGDIQDIQDSLLLTQKQALITELLLKQPQPRTIPPRPKLNKPPPLPPRPNTKLSRQLGVRTLNSLPGMDSELTQEEWELL